MAELLAISSSSKNALPLIPVLRTGLVKVGLVKVLFVSVCVAANKTKVSLVSGTVKVLVVLPEIDAKSKARILRDGKVVHDGNITSIFREKNAVKEVKNGFECGISLKDFIDFKEKDIIESYQVEKIERTI